jgi:acyl-CoA hydrolase
MNVVEKDSIRYRLITVLPNQTNNHNTMFGGEVMALMDRAAGIAALQFCRKPVVTASSERIDFRTPIQAGEIIEAVARVIYVGRTSIIDDNACAYLRRAPAGRRSASLYNRLL